jgi:hypothetical protein
VLSQERAECHPRHGSNGEGRAGKSYSTVRDVYKLRHLFHNAHENIFAFQQGNRMALNALKSFVARIGFAKTLSVIRRSFADFLQVFAGKCCPKIFFLAFRLPITGE